MKQIKLTKTAQIPDENHKGKGEPQSATNYAGAILKVSDALADQLIAEGKAELVDAPPSGPTAAAVARTFNGGE